MDSETRRVNKSLSNDTNFKGTLFSAVDGFSPTCPGLLLPVPITVSTLYLTLLREWFIVNLVSYIFALFFFYVLFA